MPLKFKKNNTVYTFSHFTQNINGISNVFGFGRIGWSSVYRYYYPAVEDNDTRYITQSSSRDGFYKYDSSSPTVKFMKNNTIYAVCNIKETSLSNVYNSPKISSLTVSSVTYGSWSAWGNWYSIGTQYQRSRTRTYKFTITIVLEVSETDVINYEKAYIKQIITKRGAASTGTTIKTTSKKTTYDNTVTYSITVSGSGVDFSTIGVQVTNYNGTVTDQLTTGCSVDAIEYQTE